MLTVSLENSQLQAVLNSAMATLRDTTPVMRAIGQQLESNINTRFATKTAPSGAAWAPWSKGTARSRADEGRGTLLSYTGRLQDSLTFTATRDSVTVGFGVPYAQYHEYGTARMPARPMLFDNNNLGEEDLADVLDAATKALRRQLRLEIA